MEKIRINQTTFKLDWVNAKAMISGFSKPGVGKLYQVMYCFTRVPQFPALITYNRTPTKFEVSNIGANLNHRGNLPKLKYVVDLIEYYPIRNDIKLWQKICDNGLFDIWQPIAPFKRFDEVQSTDYKIGLLRIFEIEEEFLLNDLRETNPRNPAVIIDTSKLNVTIKNPILSDNDFYEQKNLLENSIKDFLTGGYSYSKKRNNYYNNFQNTQKQQNHQNTENQEEPVNENFTERIQTENDFENQNSSENHQINSEKTSYTVYSLEKIEIENYFSIKQIKLENLKDKKEIYFLGENGMGKTILLQAILMCLRGCPTEKYVNNFLVDNERLEKKFKVFAIDTGKSSYGFSYPNPDVKYKKNNVFAYGVNRSNFVESETDSLGYLSLFNDDVFLTNPDSFLKETDRLELRKIGKFKVSQVIETLTKVINVSDDNYEIKIKLESDGKFYYYERGTKMRFNQLSHGYQSALVWCVDLLNRLIENQPEVTKTEDFTAIVLVDEIDLLLHPRWAYKLMGKLRKLFPKIQWFISTHSPVITLGASEDAVFYKLYKEDGESKVSEPVYGLKGMTANRLLTSLLWGIDSFTTAGTENHEINSDDYVYDIIHKVVKERIKEKNITKDSDVMVLVRKLLEGATELEKQFTDNKQNNINIAKEFLTNLNL